MSSTDQVLSWRGQELRSSDDDKLGTIEEIYLDTETNQPEWALITTGLFGTKQSFVPLHDAARSDHGVSVPFDKATVKDAPKMDPDGQLSHTEEAELYEHYGVHYGDRASGSGLPRRATIDRIASDARSDRDVNVGTVGRDVSGPTTDAAMTRSEEELRVGTTQRERGRVRLRKYVVEDHVTETVPVQREEVRVEREPITDANVDAATTGPEISSEEHEVVLHEEEPVVEKRVVPKERAARHRRRDRRARGLRDAPQGATRHRRGHRLTSLRHAVHASAGDAPALASSPVIARRRRADEDPETARLAGELRLARFHRTRDADEREALLERYLPLARSLAARYRNTSESFDDLLQVASIGLLKAIDRYDPTRRAAFSSFAVPTILGELRRHMRDHTWSVHIPRDLQELSQRLTPTTDTLIWSTRHAAGLLHARRARRLLAASPPTFPSLPGVACPAVRAAGALLDRDRRAVPRRLRWEQPTPVVGHTV